MPWESVVLLRRTRLPRPVRGCLGAGLLVCALGAAAVGSDEFGSVAGAAASSGLIGATADAAAAQARPHAVVAAGVRDVDVVRMVPAGEHADPTMTDQAVESALAAASAYWSEQTRGAVSFRVASLSDWVPSTHGCRDVQGLWDDATTKAPAGSHAQLMVVAPRSAGAPERGCDLGFASLESGAGGGRTYVTSLHPPLLAHELGHNLGLGHSGALVCDGVQDARYDNGWPAGCQVLEYDDLYDVMGYSGEGYGRGYLNAVGLDTLGVAGWSSRTVRATTAGVHVVPYSRVGEGTRIIRVEVPGEPVYYVEYRTGEGRDAEAAGGAWEPSTGVRILRSNPATGGSLELDATPGGWRYDRALPTGATFTSASGRIRITLREADGAGATLDIAVG